MELIETKMPEFIYRSYAEMKREKEFENCQYASSNDSSDGGYLSYLAELSF